MKEKYHVFWELLLILASILMFRSAWLLLDQYFNTEMLWVLLFVGIILGAISFYVINRHTEYKTSKKSKKRK